MKSNRGLEVDQKASFFCSTRHLQCLLLFIAITLSYVLRVNLSVAIVAMTDRNGKFYDITTYDWTEQQKSVVLSSFFWGYACMLLPAGPLAQKCGGKMTLLYGILISAILVTLTPMAAKIGDWKLVSALRVLLGISQGVLFPSVHMIIAKWSPVEERGLLVTYCYSGCLLGTVLTLGSSGILASSSLGWPSIFYTSGALTILWTVAFYKWGANAPNKCASISHEEKTLIENSLGGDRSIAKPRKTPWTKFFRSKPFLALTFVYCADVSAFWMLLMEMPTYMKHIHYLDVEQNALFSALPYLVMFVLSFVYGILSTTLTRRQCIGLTTNRKLFNTIGEWIPTLALIALAHVREAQPKLAIALLTITVGANAAVYLGYSVNHIDLSPHFAGILVGITDCAAQVIISFGPLFVGAIVTDNSNYNQWSPVFYVAAGLYFFGNLIFLIFGQATVQPWNSVEEKLPQIVEMQKCTTVEL